MDLLRKDLIVRIEGIPEEDSSDQMDFSFMQGLLTEIPASLDAEVDLQTGEFSLSATSFAIPATEYACRMLLTNHRGLGTASYLSDSGGIVANQTQFEIYDADLDISGPGDLFWIGNETVAVQNIVSGGQTKVINTVRGVAGSDSEDHPEGRSIYMNGPPSVALRKAELVEKDLDSNTETTIWRGLLRDAKTDDQQTEIVLDCAELMSVFWGAKGGIKNALGDPSLQVRSDGKLDGSVSHSNGWEPPNSSRTEVFVRLNDSVYEGQTNQQDGRIVFQGERTRWSTDPIDEPGERAIELDDAHVVLNKNDFEGVYGVDLGLGKYHPASIALALLLSTGDGNNNLDDGGTTRTFDVLGASWGLGIPASLIDQESWLDAISEKPLSIDRLPLGFDDASYSFKDVILGRLLAPVGLIPVIDNEGLLSLRDSDAYTVSTESGAVTLNPTRIRLDRRLRDQTGSVKAKVGGSYPDEDPDVLLKQAETGFRADTRANQTPHEVDLGFWDKGSNDERGSYLETYIESLLESAQDNPPVLTCEFPSVSSGGSEVLPSLLQWVRIKGGPETGVISPDGSRVELDDLDHEAVGLLVGKTVDLETGDVECRVLLKNWNLSNVPRLIAPTVKLEESSDSSQHSLIAGNDVFEGLAIDGTIGFKPGDEVQLVDAQGRPYWDDPGGLSINGIFNVDPQGGPINFNQSFEVVGDVYLVLENYDSYTIDPRLWAYLADDNGDLGSNEDGDTYAP